jgi:hypothetical protein
MTKALCPVCCSIARGWYIIRSGWLVGWVGLGIGRASEILIILCKLDIATIKRYFISSTYRSRLAVELRIVRSFPQDHDFSQDQTMATIQAVITSNSTSPLPLHSGESMSHKRSRSSSSRISLSELQTPSNAFPSSGFDFLLEMHLRRQKIENKTRKVTMPPAVTSSSSTVSLLPLSSSNTCMSRMRSTRTSSSSTMKSPLSISSLFDDVPSAADDARSVSSGLDFLLEMDRRREQTSIKARMISRRERTMTLAGSRKERNMILEEAFKILAY